MSRSFFWRMLHNVLPCQERLCRTSRQVQSPNCVLCPNNEADNIRIHTFSNCSHSKPAMDWILEVINFMDPAATAEKVVTLQIFPLDTNHLIECLWMIGESLQYVWARRKAKLPVDMVRMKAEIRAKCSIYSKSKRYGGHGQNLSFYLDQAA